MKKIILMMLILLSVSANAQKDVTKFLGIPVDGYKAEMKKKLIDKGFTYNAEYNYLEGEFNGRNVHIYIVTNNNKVWRIMVIDANLVGETDIKIRFNKLCEQFERNENYLAIKDMYEISESEDISYEILVNKKRYDAHYFQVPDKEMYIEKMNSPEYQQKMNAALLREYTQEQIDNPTEEQAKNMEHLKDKESTNILTEITFKKSVWFMINEFYGRYRIAMFYDNEYNESDGEDL